MSDRAALIVEARAWSDQPSRSPSDRKGDALIRSLVTALEQAECDLQALREREIERKAAVEAWFERHTNIANEAADAGNPFADVRAFVIRDTLTDFPHIFKAARDGA